MPTVSPLDIMLPLERFVGIGPGNTPICDFVPDRDVDFFILEASATGKTDIAEIVEYVDLFINGICVRHLTVAQLRYLNGIYGNAKYNHSSKLAIVIWGREDWLWNAVGAENYMFHKAGVRNMRLEVKLRDGITDPKLSGWAKAATPRANVTKENNTVRYVKVHDLTFGADGELGFQNFPWAGKVRRVYFQSAKVTKVRFKLGETEMFNLTKARQADLLRLNEQEPSDDWFVLPFDINLRSEDGIEAADLIRMGANVLPTVDGACNVKVLIESYNKIPD